MPTEDTIISGPDFPFDVFTGSVPEFLFPKMKSFPPTNILQTDADLNTSITAREFLQMTLDISEGLKELGLQEGEVVAIIGNNSTEIHAAAVGAMWAGGVFVALEPGMKQFEMDVLFTQFQPKIVISEVAAAKVASQCLNKIRADGAIIVTDAAFGSSESEFTQLQDIRVPVDIETHTPHRVNDATSDIVMIVCSSGSTGMPKGVGLTHRSVTLALQIWMHLGIEISKPCLQTSHFFWISGIFFMLFSCCFGTRRVFIRDMSCANILRAIEKYKPYWSMIPPVFLNNLLHFSEFDHYDVSSLKQLFTGGSKLSKFVGDETKRRFNVEMAQGYGMTEITLLATFGKFTDDLSSVGKLVCGVNMKVVDVNTGEALGSGKVGELLFRTPTLMKGYIGNDENTKKAVTDGWYHSGDLGYYDEHHYVYIVDRIKEVIKYRGQQIAPAELEAFISTLQGVQDTAVVGVPNSDDLYHPMALVVKKEGYHLTEDDIILAVKGNLSDYKQLRGGVRFIESIPRTGVGKIKRSALKELAQELC